MLSDYTAPVRIVRKYPKQAAALCAVTVLGQLVTAKNPNVFDAVIGPAASVGLYGSLMYGNVLLLKDGIVDGLIFKRGGCSLVAQFARYKLLMPLAEKFKEESLISRMQSEWKEAVADKPANDLHATLIKVNKAIIVCAMAFVTAVGATEDCSSEQSCGGKKVIQAIFPSLK